MQSYVQGFLPSTFIEEWPTNAERRDDYMILRNQEDLFVPFARTTFAERLPLTSFPKIWSDFDSNEIKILRNKLEFKNKIKKLFLDRLSNEVVCQRLLCPRCHLNQ